MGNKWLFIPSRILVIDDKAKETAVKIKLRLRGFVAYYIILVLTCILTCIFTVFYVFLRQNTKAM